ncbi:MAG: DNA polymerase III subunit gamma/tau [Myxococcales bacterium]|nr:DNA polymerase III subunit gamma/tau [Myxococcales bacterium]MCB9644265.1 DNA polymerase III subunit gamma/tau [Myxococcales bacterium]
MSYLVLARKWRPQRFSEVIAQPHVVQALQNAIKLDRLPHALLLTGSRGVGKTTIARLVAKTVNCLKEDREELEPCNVCEMCKEITEGRSVDVIEIDGASNRSIDDIRELRDNVQYTPTKGQRKVHIIDEVHMLTREAFNALLKTLEEPPPHVMFIFATTEPHKIPVTILSRCQRFDFKRIPTTVLRDHLRRISSAEKVRLSDTALAMVARAAQGGARDAMSLMDQVIAFGGEAPEDEAVAQAIGVVNRQILMHIGRALLQKDAAECLRAIDELFHYAYDLRQFTQELAAFLRDMMVVRICDDPDGIVDLTEDEFIQMRALVHDEEPERIQQIFRILTQAAEEIAQSNHPRLLLEMTLIRMARVEPVRPFEDLISQLSSMESRLVGLAQDNPALMQLHSHPASASYTAPQAAAPQAGPPLHDAIASLGATFQRSLQTATTTPQQPSAPSPSQAPAKEPSPFSQDPAASTPTQDASPNPPAKAPPPERHEEAKPTSAFGDDYLAATTERSEREVPPKKEIPTPPKQEVARSSSPSQEKPSAPVASAPSPSQGAPLATQGASSPNKSYVNGESAQKKAPVQKAPRQDGGFDLNDWSKTVDALSKEEGMAFLAGSLRSMPYRQEGETLSLAYPRGFVRELDETKRQIVERCLRGLGWPYSVRFVKVDDETLDQFEPCLEQARVLRDQARQDALESEVRQHEAMRAVFRAIPGAEIVRVTPLTVEEQEKSDEEESDA